MKTFVALLFICKELVVRHAPNKGEYNFTLFVGVYKMIYKSADESDK